MITLQYQYADPLAVGVLGTDGFTQTKRKTPPSASEPTRPFPPLLREGSPRFGLSMHTTPPSLGAAVSLPLRPPVPQEHLGARVPYSPHGRYLCCGAEAPGPSGLRASDARAQHRGEATLQPGEITHPAPRDTNRGLAGFAVWPR